MTGTKPPLSKALVPLRFKGDRDYLHGTDLLAMCRDALLEEYPAGDLTDIDIAFHGLAKTGVTLCSATSDHGQARARFNCRIDAEEMRFVVVTDGRPVVDRIDYDEGRIVAATEIRVAQSSAVSAGSLPFTNIERWVAMTKALHRSLYPAFSGRWLFVRGTFPRYVDADGAQARHEVVLQASLGGRLTRSAVLVDGRGRGDIFFSPG